MKKQIKVIYANMVVLLAEVLVLPLVWIASMICRLFVSLIPKKFGLTDKDMWKLTSRLQKNISKIIGY